MYGRTTLTSGSAMAEGPRDVLSVEILQLQNIPFENEFQVYRVALFVFRFCTIPECARDTQTNRRTDRHTTTACIALSIASRGKNRPYCTAIKTRKKKLMQAKHIALLASLPSRLKNNVNRMHTAYTRPQWHYQMQLLVFEQYLNT